MKASKFAYFYIEYRLISKFHYLRAQRQFLKVLMVTFNTFTTKAIKL